MKIRLLDGSIYPVERVDVSNGKLEIDFVERSPEELQAIFSTPALLEKIDLLGDDNELVGEHTGWTVYAGIFFFGDRDTVSLIKEADSVQNRITTAEAKAIEAASLAREAQETLENATTQITDLQLALCEMYEERGM